MKHLLIDTPSVDRYNDNGKLGNHHIFFSDDKGYNYNTITEFAFIKNDNWQILPSPGDKDRDMYTRAAVAMRGTFALSKPETAYFHAFNDIEDVKLIGNWKKVKK